MYYGLNTCFSFGIWYYDCIITNGEIPMKPHRFVLIIASLAGLMLCISCTDDSVALKQKMSELEKKVQKQEKDLREFAVKFAPPKDFSADIQRIEDSQDKISQVLKTKVDPVNAKLEEFRDWAQEAQKERDSVTKKLKALEQSALEVHKRFDAERGEAGKIGKDVVANKKLIQGLTKNIEDLNKNYADVRKELTDSNEKIIGAVKKTLPKLKEAAVAEIKSQITPLEQNILALKTSLENDRKAIAGIKMQPPIQQTTDTGGKDVQFLVKRIKELEDIVTAQKSYLLEMGSKMHELELQLRGVSGTESSGRPMSRR
jgi:chromosome segregation ATPase